MARDLRTIIYTATLVISALFLHNGLQAEPPSSPQKWQGFVTDTHCGTNCQVTKSMTPDKKCVDRCVREGSKYGLWVGQHVYELEPQSTAAKFAAANVVVRGTLKGEIIHIISVERKPSLTTKKAKIN